MSGARLGDPASSRRVVRFLLAAAFLASSVDALGLDGGDDLDLARYASMSLEELMNTDVESVVGREQSWFESPAAVHVITAEDIRRSGQASLADLLRTVPGMNVARVDSHTWAISARGFQGVFANKLLVLIDGRSVYDPLFSGTYWDQQSLPLDDVERIEVIRGPGSTLWGANAVNGVINVITKPSSATAGTLVRVASGTGGPAIVSARHGGTFGTRGHYRAWLGHRAHPPSSTPTGGRRPDDWTMSHGGVRLDHATDRGTELLLLGNLHWTDQLGESVVVPVPGHLTTKAVAGIGRARGGSSLVRISRPESGWTFQSWIEVSDRTQFHGVRARHQTLDVEYRRRHDPGRRHELLWGVGWRGTRDRVDSIDEIGFRDERGSTQTLSGFVQDTIRLADGTLALTWGTKISHHGMGGFAIQPSVRFSWTPGSRHHLWWASSRPIRNPSRSDTSIAFVTAWADTGVLTGSDPNGTFVPLRVHGNEELEPETKVAHELGYRVRIGEELLLDVSLFHDDYSDLIVAGPGVESVLTNGQSAVARGGELLVQWQPLTRWQLSLAGSYVDVSSSSTAATNSPRHQAAIRSQVDVSRHLDLDVTICHVGEIPSLGLRSRDHLDLGLTWRPHDRIELSLIGRNLLDGRHVEYRDRLYSPSAIDRSWQLSATFRL